METIWVPVTVIGTPADVGSCSAAHHVKTALPVECPVTAPPGIRNGSAGYQAKRRACGRVEPVNLDGAVPEPAVVVQTGGWVDGTVRNRSVKLTCAEGSGGFRRPVKAVDRATKIACVGKDTEGRAPIGGNAEAVETLR
jgi:hypothetical protein